MLELSRIATDESRVKQLPPVRCTRREFDQVSKAAKVAGLSLTDLVRVGVSMALVAYGRGAFDEA